jgi:hypothetical protein
MTYLLNYLESHPCVDCGESDRSVLEFDHLEDKSFNISRGFRDRPWSQVLAEIEKCEVRCANCHKLRTGRSRGWYQALLSDDAPDDTADTPFLDPDFIALLRTDARTSSDS